jgi:hypothetical protein
MTTQRLIIAAGWLAAAVLAVLVGLVAISVIGDGLVSSTGRPLAESEVAKRLAAEPAPSEAPSETSPSPSGSPPSAGESKTRRTPGGTVTARCTGGEAAMTMAPAQGYTVHENRGPEGEFRSTSDNHDRVKIRVSCAGDVPQISQEVRDR